MSLFSTIKKRYSQITPKQFVLAGVFMLALAGAIGGGFASRQLSTAAVSRDCKTNSIDYKDLNGGCGAADPAELIKDIRDNNPSDLQTIYADPRIGLPGDKYVRFANTALPGKLMYNGDLIVDNEVVMTNAWTMGRESWGNPERKPITIGGKTYYHAPTQVSFASGVDSIPTMVMFDEEGTVEAAIENPCGNPIPKGDKVKSGAECKALVKTPVDGKKNTYKFTTNATTFGRAKIVKYDYYYDEGNGERHFASTTKGDDAVEKTFTKGATVTVKVTIKLPGRQEKTITSDLCEKEVGVVKEEFLYACDAVISTARDNTNRKFRFTVKTKQSNNVTVDSADFTLDDTVTAKDITDQDDDGNIYKDYDFTDTNEHEVSVVVNFTADGKSVVSKETDCVAKVTPEKAPECPEKPGSGFPPGDERCKEKELPKTGATGVAGLFTGITAAGALGHRWYTSRRARR